MSGVTEATLPIHICKAHAASSEAFRTEAPKGRGEPDLVPSAAEG